MTTFRIRQRTCYTYDGPVAFGPHRLLIRPRDGHDMRILESSLVLRPAADVRWAFDTFGNSVALLTFEEAANELVIESELTVRRYGVDEPLPRIARHAGAYPVDYDPDELFDLAPFLAIQFPEDRPAVEGWIRSALPDLPAETTDILERLAAAIHSGFAYGRREERGVQSPGATILLGRGTCRDFAVLFIEAARFLGFAARFVTGYLYDPGADGCDDRSLNGGGSTHAWADVFIPGVGWIEFDPTNRIVAGRNLLRVAVTRTQTQALIEATRADTPALLKGLLFGPDGAAFSPTHTRKGGRLYRYYVSQTVLKHGAGSCPVGRVPAGEIETAVIDQLRAMFRQPEIVAGTWKAARAHADITEADARSALQQLDPLWDELFPAEQARIVALLVERADVGTGGLNVRLRVDGLEGLAREMQAGDIGEAA